MIFPWELKEEVAVKGDRSKEILLICGTCACAYYKGKVIPLQARCGPEGG